jgi:hypothetical protein
MNIDFHSYNHTEVLRLSKDGIWANPDIPVDEAAKLVLAAMEWNIKVLVDKAVADEREKYKWDVHSCGPTCKRYACVAMREAVEAEREACALLIEENAQECSGPMGLVLQANADAIRNRSNT